MQAINHDAIEQPEPAATETIRTEESGPPHAGSPLFTTAVSFALGVYLAGAGHTGQFYIEALPVLAGVCLLAGLLALRAGWKRVSLLLALAGFLAAGASAGCLFAHRFPPNHISMLASRGIDPEDPIRLEGQVASTPISTSYGLHLDLETARAEWNNRSYDLTGKVRLRIEASRNPEAAESLDSLRLQYGDNIRVLLRLRRPQVYRNPGSFDFRHWMESNEDIYWTGVVKSPLLVEKLPRTSSGGIWIEVERIRGALLKSIDRLYPRWSAQGRYGTVLKAVLLGERSSLDSETIENFRRTGLYHLLVIAGLHVGLLALLANWLLRLLPIGKSPRCLLVLAFLVSYSFLVEQRAPTLRATLMISLYLLARLLGRSHSVLNTIGLAATCLLLWRPAWLFESGFQLSFSAALLIAGLVAPILERTTEPYRRALRKISDLALDARLAPKQAQFRLDLRALIAGVSARFRFLDRHPALAGAAVMGPARLVLWTANLLLFSTILQAGLLLPMATTFHRVAFVGIGLNALAIPLMTVLLGLAIPTVALGALIPALAALPAKALAVVMAGLFALTGTPHLPGWLSFRVPAPPLWVGCGFVLSVLIAALALGRHGLAFKLSMAAFGLMTALIAIHPFSPRLPSGILEVTALDCGGGDALFVVFPDKTTMLVDASGSREAASQGRRWDPGEDIVSPYLWSRGIKKIDIVTLSNPHEDPMGGLSSVLQNFRVGEFWDGPDSTALSVPALLELLRQKGVATRTLTAGDVLMRGGASVRALWPARSWRASSFNANDSSLVLRATFNKGSLLLPGDISSKAEQELLASGEPLESQVLKVAHHGSKTSTSPEFLDRVAPRLAIVTGSASGFGNLPSPETLERIRERGIAILRPENVGAITVEIGEGILAVRCYGARPPDSTTRAGGDCTAGNLPLNVR